MDVLAQPLGKGTLISGMILLILLPAVLLGQYAPPPYRLPYRWRWVLLCVQALLTYLPVLVFEHRWLGLLGFLAGAVLLTVPRPVSVVIALAVAASGPLLLHSNLVTTQRTDMSVLVSTVITGGGVYAIVHLALLVARLQAAQRQTARSATHRERARITQDLHDLVGSSLVSIAIQSESALLHASPSTPAHQALSDIAALARRTHGEVRDIARGRVSTRLHTELAYAQRVLSSADVDTRTTFPAQYDLPAVVGGCLSAVVREGVGNLLQHSQATWCHIAATVNASHVRLSVTNDGARPSGGGHGFGSGLASLRLRVLALGGTLVATAADGRFTLTVKLPLDPALSLSDPNRVHEGSCM
ncbi:histidine kinase [Streptomyces shenzhenensis]|uniref:sensor histidine kinase n=1 Tax=Streptomyces shenzhenensis TaxID=943815 RepID=UPI0033D4D246